MTNKQERVTIIGSGAWATALALTVTRAGHKPVIWGRNQAVLAEMVSRKSHPALPDIRFEEALITEPDIEIALKDSRAVFIVVPTQNMRSVLAEMKSQALAKIPFILCSKGIEIASGKTVSEIFLDIFPENPFAILSGPNFAIEVARNRPTATVVASKDDSVLSFAGTLVGHAFFRPYFTRDIAGVEIGGSLKNILAIATGITRGRELGENAEAALITRGLAEMSRFAMLRGGQAETLSGLSGLGDLLLSCGSLKSRNMKFGYQLGQAQKNQGGEGRKPSDHSPNVLAEGFWTSRALAEIKTEIKHDCAMPICETVFDILHRARNIDDALQSLLSRPHRYEVDKYEIDKIE